MYVARVPNRTSPPAVLLRESYRDGGKVKNRTLANLSRWPEDQVDALSRVLKGLPPRVDLTRAFEGHTCPLGKIGHARDGVHGRLQIVYGLLATTAGVPVAVEVFELSLIHI